MKTWRLQNAYKHPNFVTLKISSIYIALFIMVLENNNINISVNWDFIFSESVSWEMSYHLSVASSMSILLWHV